MRALGVQRHHVPGAEVVGVVALVARAGRPVEDPGPVEVVEVARRAGGAVLVVADGGVHLGLQAAPGGVEGALELVQLAVLVLQVPERQDRRHVQLHQLLRRLDHVAGVARAEAGREARQARVAGDVACRRDHRVAATRLPVDRPRVAGARTDLAHAVACAADRVQPAPPGAAHRERDRLCRPATTPERRRRRAAASAAAPWRRSRASPTAPAPGPPRACACGPSRPSARGIRSGRRVKAIRRPSGDQTGSRSSVAPPVSGRARCLGALRVDVAVAHEGDRAARGPRRARRRRRPRT